MMMTFRKMAKEGIMVKGKTELGVTYDAIEPPEISYKEAIDLLGDQKKWKKLSMGEKLNAIRVYVYGIAGELNMKAPDVHLIKYKGLIHRLFASGHASETDNIYINILHLRECKIRETVAHEVKHNHQQYAFDDGYKPKTLPGLKEQFKWWRGKKKTSEGKWIYAEKGMLGYFLNPQEIDARRFAEEHSRKVFGTADDSRTSEDYLLGARVLKIFLSSETGCFRAKKRAIYRLYAAADNHSKPNPILANIKMRQPIKLKVKEVRIEPKEAASIIKKDNLL